MITMNICFIVTLITHIYWFLLEETLTPSIKASCKAQSNGGGAWEFDHVLPPACSGKHILFIDSTYKWHQTVEEKNFLKKCHIFFADMSAKICVFNDTFPYW